MHGEQFSGTLGHTITVTNETGQTFTTINSEVAIFITETNIDSFYRRKHIQTEQGCSQSRSDLTSEMTVH